MTIPVSAAPLVVLVLASAAACSSGPPPVDTRPYEQQVQAARGAKDAAFRDPRNDDSPIPPDKRAAFPDLVYYPIDGAYRVPASLTETPTARPVIIELETSQGQRERYRKVGTLGFTLKGQPLRLSAFADVNARTFNQLFVPFGDLTNQSETYRGGRYLQLARTATGLYDLDFNQAFHPYCVYNYDYECPVPPPENRLAIAIPAGEKLGPK
jgi:uncharacterized protein (DUF1684 family)